jgi:peptidoglycan/LPS O-acetylase OafA/YrhL
VPNGGVTAAVAEPKAPADPRRLGFRPDIEGLRAVAILLVVLYHSVPHAAPGGYIGVDVFFVISGFLITGQLVRELETRHRISFLAFYARRARRILPGATLVIVSTVIASSILLAPLAARRLFTDAIVAAFFGVNFRFAAEGANYFTQNLPPSPLQHFWSLSVEEQFYVVWPMLLLVSSLVWLQRRRARKAAAGAPGTELAGPDGAAEGNGAAAADMAAHPPPSFVAVAVVLGAVAVFSFLASVWQTPTSPSWAYYSIVSRGWELACGALVGLALPLAARLGRRVSAALSWAGLACVALAADIFNSSTQYPGYRALLPVAGAVAVIVGGSAAIRPKWGAEALLGTVPFQQVGAWSYSWYLWHWPFLILAPAVLGHSLSVPENLLVAALSLGVAVVSFTFVERPIRRMQLVVRRPVIGLVGGATLALASILAAVSASAALPSLVGSGAAVHLTLPKGKVLTAAELQADLVKGLKTTAVPSNLTPSLKTAAGSEPIINHDGCHLQYPGTRSKPCVFGDTSSKTTVVMFGDSHMAAWFPALDTISIDRHWRLVDFTKAGCTPAEVTIVRNSGTTPYPDCTAWRKNSMASIATMHPSMILVQWDRDLVPEARKLAGVPAVHGWSIWQDGVAATFKAVKADAKLVVFITDTPELVQLAPDCVSAHLSNVYPCTTALNVAIRQPVVRRQELAIAASDGIKVLDPLPFFCTPTRCPVIVGNIIVYRDNAHMVPVYSNFIEPVVDRALINLGAPA